MVARVWLDAEAEAVVSAYCHYERVERRLAESTVTGESDGVRQFLAWRAETNRSGLDRLEPVELSEFILHEASRLSVASMRSRVSTLRSFVRFLFATGVTSRDLWGSVPKVAGSRFDGLPKAVDPSVVDALLGSCDRTGPTGRRDFAILVLMSRLGLRAIEVAGMQLDDIDWRAGELDVRGKGGRRDRLPLPTDVGEALVEYLGFGRRPSQSRAVFLQATGPAVGMSRNAVVFVSRNASRRAGLPVVGGRRLRHTAATELLRHGASLREVGQILRHDDDTTTAIYAKIDRASLSLVVRSWPQERQP
jgi:site-specific recombinase XerD